MFAEKRMRAIAFNSSRPTKKIKELSDELAELRLPEEKKQFKIEQLEQDIKILKVDIDHLSQEKKIKSELLKIKGSEQDQLDHEMKEVQIETQAFISAVNNSSEEKSKVEELKAQLAELKQQYEKNQSEYIELQSEIRDIDRSLGRKQSKSEELDKMLATLQLSPEEIESKSNELLREIANNETYIVTLNNERQVHEEILKNYKPQLKSQINQFKSFYKTLEVMDTNVQIRLIGDEVADRGSDDYFTLKLIQLVTDKNDNMSILLSNHGLEFINTYEENIEAGNKLTLPEKPSLDDAERPSLIGLKLLYDNGFITNKEITNLINKSYKPFLKILDYTLSDEGITLISHAPIKFIPALKAMTAKLNLAYSDRTAEELGKTIDRVNQEITKSYIYKNKIHELFELPEITATMNDKQMSEYPFAYALWNRFSKLYYDKDESPDVRPSQHNGYELKYAHGHDPYISPYQHIFNLDTNFGKLRPGHPNYSAEEDQKYKALNSDEFNLAKRSAPPKQSIQTTHDHDARTGKFALIASAIGFGLGLIVGLALTLSGVFAPLGLGLIGLVAMAASISGAGAALGAGVGIGVAKGTEPPVEAIQQEPANKSTSLKAIGEMGGLDQETRNSLDNTASPKHSVREVTPLEPPSDSNQLAQNALVNAAPDTPPKKVEEEAESGLSMKVS
ncbi:MAG: hypothetical protein J0I93_07730 [Legionella sp.]|nr:hypothetical protein [Legionella sp.]